MPSSQRQSTGVPGLDQHLGGGLLPGTLTVVVGATGAGKTQLGLQFLRAGLHEEGHSGIVLDMTARGDSQHHEPYAERMFGWRLRAVPPDRPPEVASFFRPEVPRGDYLHVFDHSGRQVTRADRQSEQWHQWQRELNRKLQIAIAFLYGNLLDGCRRVLVDGIEPVDRPADSVQLELFEYVYHQILRKDPEWVARDLFRENFWRLAKQVQQHLYPADQVGCMLACTSHHTMLEGLIDEGIRQGDVLANANTVIYMGKMRQGNRIGRGLYIAKHRGSACSDQIVPYTIGAAGLAVVADGN